MYIEVYDKNLNHISNIINVKYNITRRVFDLDTALFEGVCEDDISTGFIYVFCDDVGNYIYSGFMGSINQRNNYVNFKGIDLKSVFDTEITLDFSSKPAPKIMSLLFQEIKAEFLVQSTEIQSILPINIDYVAALYSIDWIANYDYQFIVVNVKDFLKPYLAYYGYYIQSKFDKVEKKLDFKITTNTNIREIKIEDFSKEVNRNDISVNKAIAVLKYDNVNPDEKIWIKSTAAYWEGLEAEKKFEGAASLYDFEEPDNIYYGSNIFPLEDIDQFDLGSGYKLGIYQDNPEVIEFYEYFKVSNGFFERPTDLPVAVYYLGNDNQIYSNNIPVEKMILPIKARIFENEYFEQAQAEAISELVNSRYNENIILTNTNSPIDLRELNLYDFVKIYDDNGFYKEMPVSEIAMTNNLYRVKLGFKKTLFTEVIKGWKKH